MPYRNYLTGPKQRSVGFYREGNSPPAIAPTSKPLVVPGALRKAMAERAREVGSLVSESVLKAANRASFGAGDYGAAAVDALGRSGKHDSLQDHFEDSLAERQALTRTGAPYDGSVGLIVRAPPGVSLEENIREAERRHDPVWFFNQVKPFGPWDYKRKYGRAYEEFGNLNYGATGRATGFPAQVLRVGAGAMQVGSDAWGQVKRVFDGELLNKAPNPLAVFQYPYGDNNALTGDETPDQPKIDRGIRRYDRRGK